jgi:hypothetical protein
MKKTLFFLLLSFVFIFPSLSQDSKFDEKEFVNYANSLRKKEMVRCHDYCYLCVEEVFTFFNQEKIEDFLDIVVYAPKLKGKHSQVIIIVPEKSINLTKSYLPDMFVLIKKEILNQNNKHFILEHKKIENGLIIYFHIFK